MVKIHIPLYERLPEIYRIRDAEGQPPEQLKHYLALVEEAFGAIYENVESLYHDLFIESCDEWVIPYIGDLLGTSHLKGDPWTLRADVADTIALRRRKGTLGAIALLTYNLTRWGVHCVELRNNLVWNQHLNHQRQDEGGLPPYGDIVAIRNFVETGIPTRHRVIRGGTVTLRDPAMLSLLNTPFDAFAHVADLKPPSQGTIRVNLPNLAIFLWRLAAYRISLSKPLLHDAIIDNSGTEEETEAQFIASFYIHPLGQPLKLFNTYRFDPDNRPPVVTQIDETPGPIPAARLTEGSEAGNPKAYVSIDTYDETNDATVDNLELSEEGLQLHLPASVFEDQSWKIRGANLCAWEAGLQPPLENYEVAIDPVIGRIVFGVDNEGEAQALVNHLLLTYTYGAVGPVGAHPFSRPSSPMTWVEESVDLRTVNFHNNPTGLQEALHDIQDSDSPIVIEIQDSMTHVLDLSRLSGVIEEDSGYNLLLNRSLIIRAADYQRPVIRLAQPLRFRPLNVRGDDEEEQEQFDAIMNNLTVRLEGLYLTRTGDFDPDEPLIARAAIHRLEIIGCTLDPGGNKQLNGTAIGMRAPIRTAMILQEPYGFDDPEEEAFKQTPEIILQRSVTGPLLIDTGYRLFLTDSLIDAGSGVNDETETSAYAVSGASDPVDTSWGPPTRISGITVLGRMRVESINGNGGIWVHTLEVLDNQKGCIKYSYFAGKHDRLPQNHGCVKGIAAKLQFTSDIYGEPAYGQLAHTTDFRIRERGPRDDAMGAFGFLLGSHKWRNLQIRYREFMPVGIRPLLIPVT